MRVGTRGSPLALIQTRLVIEALRPHRAAEPAIIRTTGDAVQDRRLADLGGKGLFAKEIHEALLDGRIDLAMHSLKDLETALPPGIVLACTLPREDPATRSSSARTAGRLTRPTHLTACPSAPSSAPLRSAARRR